MRDPSSDGTVEQEEPEEPIEEIGGHGPDEDEPVVDAAPAQRDVNDGGGGSQMPEQQGTGLEEGALLGLVL